MYPFIEILQHDLKIPPYSEEPVEQWHCRLIYSAMALWLKTMVLDVSPFATFELLEKFIGETEQSKSQVTCVHRRHLRHRGAQILEEMLRHFSPEVCSWFMKPYHDELDKHTSYDGTSNKRKCQKLHPIRILCERMLQSGELTGWTRYQMALPKPSEVALTPMVNRFYGLSLSQADSRICSGMAWLECRSDESENEFEEIYEIAAPSKTTSESAHEVWHYLRSVPEWFQLSSDTTELEYSDPYSKDIPSRSWKPFRMRAFLDEDKYRKLPFCVWRRPLEHSYGLLRYQNRRIVSIEFSEYQRDLLEWRRFIHVSRATVDNPIRACLKSFDNCFQLRLQAGLPKREETILLSLGWSQRSITDMYHLIFPLQIRHYIERLLQQLNIQIQHGK